MAHPLRILIVEDRAEDAELMVLHLEDAGFLLSWQRVETERDYLDALDPPPDLILADWALPQFSGLHALQLLHERGQDIPFIIVSGSVGEEAAVDALRQGAYDYVLKDRLSRFGVAARRALEEKRLRQEHERAELALRENEERYRRISEMISDYAYAFRIEADGALIREWTVGGFQSITGYTTEELDALGGWITLIHPDDMPIASARDKRLHAGDADVSEFRIVRKDGEVRWLRDHGYPVWDATHSRMVGLHGAAQDITESKRRAQEREALAAVAQAMGKSTELDPLLHDLLDAAIHAIPSADTGVTALVDPAGGGNKLQVRAIGGRHAPQVESLARSSETGWSARVMSLRRAMLIPDVGDNPDVSVPDALIASTEDLEAERVQSAILAPLLVRDQVIGVIGLGNAVRKAAFNEEDLSTLVTFAASVAVIIERARLSEITQRRLTELDVLHQASRRLLAAHLDPEDTYKAVHEAVARIMPCEAFAIVLENRDGKDYHGVYFYDQGRRHPPTRIRRGRGLSSKVISSGVSQMIDDLAERPDIPVVHIGEPEPVRSVLAVPLSREGHTIGMLSTQSYRPNAFDANHRVLLETLAAQFAAAIENSHLHQHAELQARQMTQLMESVPEGVLRLGAAGRVVVANRVAERDLAALAQIGVGDILTHLGDQSLDTLLSPPPKGVWHEVKAGARVFEVIARPMQDGDETTDWVVVINDVTEERETESQLRRQERLAAVGQLAAGIAHDFRNLLTSIILYAQLTLENRNLAPNLAPNLRTIVAESNKATNLVQQILDFSSRAIVNMQSLEMADHVANVVSVLSRTIPEHITLTLDIRNANPGATAVKADPGRIQQVLTNLALNARDAMPNGGVLRFTVSREGNQPASYGAPPPVPEMDPGDLVCLAVSDTGTGMTEEVQAHLFEPFFTTKDVDKGTGLGLAQVYGIVRQHQGHINVESAPGQGTTFRIYLPASERPVQETAPEVRDPMPLGRGETILLVEDQAQLREAGRAVLISLDYNVVTAQNGRRALDLYRLRSQAGDGSTPVDLVITDLVMPEMGGVELLRELRSLRPDLPVLVMTGYAMQSNDLDALTPEDVAGVVLKPFEIDTLARKVRRALDKA